MNTYKILTTKLLAVAAMTLIPLTAAQAVQHFGLGASTPLQIGDLPSSGLRSKLEQLPAQAQDKALTTLRKLAFTDNDIRYMQVDKNGGVYFVDSFLPPPAPAAALASADAQVPLISSADAFSLHSKKGAKNIIYLDFNGMDITGTAWNGSVTTYKALPYDVDGSPTTFSPTELNNIADVWHRISEDYMPFNVDVTTKEPKTFGSTVGRILITKNVDKNGVAMPYSTAGGVAYVGAWGYSNYSYYSPALVYYNNLGGGWPPYVAEASSHEMGHNLGLSHDGTSTVGYYAGLGTGAVSWGPIMGVGYYTNVTEWSKGEYPDANQKQDDMAIIAGNLKYRADDHGKTLTTATPLVVDTAGTIAATNPETDPHDTNTANKGVIGKLNDVDMFSFSAGAGPLTITVNPAWDAFYHDNHRGANLDIKATLYNWDGTVVKTVDPLGETNAVISTTVPAGQYYLSIKGVGNSVTPYSTYDSLGQYFIRGTVTP
ncbi:MAG: zinc-dependent metalloprotease family protein [Methylovulum sp.]|nr:zinc-dependent metalloprotease family protein [Methylovulum sp.]